MGALSDKHSKLSFVLLEPQGAVSIEICFQFHSSDLHWVTEENTQWKSS